MCLLSTSIKPKKAKEDIVCYKFFFKRNGRLISPWTHFEWRTNVTYTARKAKPMYPNEIKDGYFHSFTTNEIADEMADHYSGIRHCYVYECVIPKGTYYYTGEHRGLSGYASKKLIIKKNVSVF